jgi:uncharacterized membrane protein
LDRDGCASGYQETRSDNQEDNIKAVAHYVQDKTKQKPTIDEPLDYPSSLSSTCLTILLTLILLVITACILLMVMFLCFGIWVIKTATAFPQHHLGDLL